MRSSRLTRPAAALVFLLLGARVAAAQTETLPFAPVADCYVAADTPTTTFNDANLKVDGNPVKVAYVRFAVTGVNGRAVQQARLRIGAVTATASGGSVHAITNHTWNETAVTYNTRPAVDGPALVTLGAIAAGAVAEFNLDGKVTGDGTYDFALDSTNSDGVTYGSSATTGQKPTLVLTVAAGPEPTITILQPANGAGFFVGDQITFQGNAADTQDGNLSPAITWSSDHDGALGTGATVTTSLSQGSHVVTAGVTDADSHTTTAQVSVAVAPPPPANTQPLVTITAPPNGQTLSADQPITLKGTAEDLEDGTITAALAWTSSLDGALGSGGTVTHALSAGAHTITARAKDSGNLQGSASILVNVTAPTVIEFTPTADAYVDAGATSTKFGTASILRIDSSAVRTSYLRFAVAGVGGRPITHAVLRLQVDSASGANSNNGGEVHTITDTSWQESAITYANRPAVNGPTVATRTTAVALNQVVDFDLGSALSGDGTKSFAIVSSSSDNADYRSRESATPPKLILTLGGNAPEVAITAPATGTVVFAGAIVSFTATATDVEDGDLAAQVHWTSSLDGALGTGATLPVSTLRIGTHTITASATDASALTGQAQITLRVRGPNAAPTLTITAPASGATFPAGTTVAIAGTANDDFDGVLSPSIQWSSDRDGALGTGASLSKVLHEGAHTITATVTDSDGAPASAQVGVTITPTAPVVTITAPAVNAAFFQGPSIAFAGSASDATSGDLSSALQWSSDLAGPIGTGPSFSLASLGVGTHVITASASDGTLTGQAQRTIVVRPPNALPVVTIQSPTDGASLLAGKPVLLAATATDAENGNLGAAVKWTSSRDGALGTGAQRTLSTLSVGTHVLTAAVTDLDGSPASATVTVAVFPATLTFNPTADTYVDASNAAKSFGTTTTMTADGSPVKQILMRFPVSGIGAFAVDQAHLLLTTGTASAAAGKVGGTVQRFDDHNWTEATTYAARPAITGPVLANITSAVKANKAVDFTVTSGVTGDGILELALVTTNSDDVIYQTRESTKKPQLVVTLKQNTAPVLTITSPPVGAYANAGTPVTFTATATDAESGNLGAQIAWTSSLDGALGTGASLTKSNLTPGAHTVTASVTDSSGASAQAQVTVTIGHPPVVAITTPANQAKLFTPSFPVAFTATATDVEDGDIAAQVHWTSSIDGSLGIGGTVAPASLSIGLHTITAAVTDAAGAAAQAQITVRVRTPNTAPSLTLTSPANGASAPAGSTWTLGATATDDFDGPMTAQIKWTSSLSGALGTGGSLSRILAEGTHTLTASVTDSDGVPATAQVTVTVSTTPPAVTITAPAAGALNFAGEPVQFAATAVDATDGDVAGALQWTSSINGLIGTGAAFGTSALSAGTHTVTTAVVDASGLTGQAQLTVVVKPHDDPPVLTLSSPSDGASVFIGKPVTLAATATDAEDGNLSGLVHWTSNRDGALGNGASLVVSTLSAGTHVLTASVTDLDGRAVQKTVTLNIVPPTLAFAADADTYVDAGATTTKFGTATSLVADNSPVKQAFLRFTVSGIGTTGVQSAKLRLTVAATSAATSASGGSVHRITNGSWSEAATTYANRPSIDGPVLATRGTAVALNEVVELDVTAAVQGEGIYNFALDTTSSDDVIYQSREATTGQPQLVITLRNPDAPAVTITTPATAIVAQPSDTIAFAGNASDPQDGNVTASLQWTSSIDGTIGTGASFSRILSIGVHTITATATDSTGGTGSASVTVDVRSGGAVGYRDFTYPSSVESGQSNEATAQKPESKLWYVDGTWWATLYRTAAGAHRIHRLDLPTQTWVDTGVSVDSRPESKQDVLWDGAKLYLASRYAGSPAQNRLYRYSYQPALKTWTLDAGFPVDISGGGTESMTIAKDSTGTLWIAYTLNSTVVVNRTVGSDTQWGAPFNLPVSQGTSVDADDIAGVISMPGKIGVFWTNQKTATDYFAWRADGTPATDAASWHVEVAVSGSSVADDHFNMKCASDGRLFVGIKTSRTGNGDILMGLLVRATNGTWAPMYSVVDISGSTAAAQVATRPLVVLDEVHSKIYYFFSPLHESIGYKVSDMNTIAFPSGLGTPFMTNPSTNDLNNPQSTKQSAGETGGRIVVISSSRIELTYFHNSLLAQ